jgi:hypothetical protein
VAASESPRREPGAQLAIGNLARCRRRMPNCGCPPGAVSTPGRCPCAAARGHDLPARPATLSWGRGRVRTLDKSRPRSVRLTLSNPAPPPKHDFSQRDDLMRFRDEVMNQPAPRGIPSAPRSSSSGVRAADLMPPLGSDRLRFAASDPWRHRLQKRPTPARITKKRSVVGGPESAFS